MDYREYDRLLQLAEDLRTVDIAKNEEVKFSDLYPHKQLPEKKKRFTVKKNEL